MGVFLLNYCVKRLYGDEWKKLTNIITLRVLIVVGLTVVIDTSCAGWWKSELRFVSVSWIETMTPGCKIYCEN